MFNALFVDRVHQQNITTQVLVVTKLRDLEPFWELGRKMDRGVTKPSVSYATKRLRESGYITMDKEGLITLTDTGMAIAASMLDRHKTLTRFLIHLGVEPETAEADACKIEHDISQETFQAICRHAGREG